jgi:exodeoxyribonuclease VII small subunit
LTISLARVNASRRKRGVREISQEQPKIDAMSFEQALQALEEIVQQLESGSVPLDQSIDLYEKGEGLRKHCQARLDAAQAKIESIVAGKDGAPTGTKPFDADK